MSQAAIIVSKRPALMGAGTSSGRGVARARGSGGLGEEGADQQVETGHIHPLLRPINALVSPPTVYILGGYIY